MANLKEEASQRSRERLIEAATDLFSRQGYRSTSVEEIAAAAGISRGSIFWHFKSKAGLLLAAVDDAFNRWLGYWDQAQRDDQMRPALASMFEIFRVWVRDPCARLMPMLLFEALREGSPLREPYADRYELFRRHFVEWAEHHRDRSWPEELSPERFATVVWGALIGAHLQWRLDPERVDYEGAMIGLEAMLARLERVGAAADPAGASLPSEEPALR